MKYSCDMIKDLLPLYFDGACSTQSRHVVEEHLGECDSCRDLLKKMQDTTCSDCLLEEKKEVIRHYTNNLRRKILLAGLCTAAVVLLTCLIVNIATGRALDWFFIVLTSLMVLASVTAVPLAVEKRKQLWTFCAFTASLLLLLMTCCLYSEGSWFFVAAAGSLLGMSVVFLPCVIGQIPLRGFASRNKSLIAMSTDTIFLYLLIAACGFYINDPGFWRPAMQITTVAAAFTWILFVILRYLRVNGLIKAGICSVLCGIFIAFINDIISWILDQTARINLADANLMKWNTEVLVNANTYLLILLAGCTAGVILILAGIFHRSRKK